jgi:hypothetical protein
MLPDPASCYIFCIASQLGDTHDVERNNGYRFSILLWYFSMQLLTCQANQAPATYFKDVS